MNDQIFRNLVNNTYIYSHTSHFQENLDKRIAFGANPYFTLEKLKNMERQLENNIDIITQKCNFFYNDIGIKEQDYVKINNGKIDISLNGAKAFEKKYLIKNNVNNSNSLKDRASEINDILVSLDYQNAVLKQLKNNATLLVNNQDFANNFFINIINNNSKTRDAAVKELIRTFNDKTVIDLDMAIDILFATRKDRKAREKTLTIKQEKILKSFLTGMGKNFDEIFKKVQNNKRELEKLRNSLKRELSGSIFKKDDVMAAMCFVLINQLKKRGIKIQKKEEEIIKKVMEKELSPALSKVLVNNEKENMIIFEVGEQRLNGLIFEQSITLSVNIDYLFNNRKDLKQISNGVINGIATVVGQEKDEKGRQIKTDIQIKGKSGAVYNIQAKNSFSTSDYDAIHVQSDIKVKTFANEIFNNEDDKKLFEFFILNRAFLSKGGLENKDNGKSTIKAPLGTKDNTNLILLIQFFLNQAIFHLLGMEVLSKINGDDNLQKTKSGHYNNLFFIYKKSYMIPVSVFLFSALDCLNLLIQKAEKEKEVDFLNSIGRLTYSKDLTGFSQSYTYRYNQNFRQEKLNAVDVALKNGKKNQYPGPLVEVGRTVGTKMLSEAFFKGVNFTLSMKKLNSILQI